MHSEVQVQPPSRDKAQPHTKHQVSGSAASPGTSCSSQPRCWGCIPVADRSLRVGGSSWGSCGLRRCWTAAVRSWGRRPV